MSGDSETVRDEPTDIPKSRKILYAVSTAIIVVAISFMLVILFWLLYPYKTADLKVPVEVLNQNNKIGVGEKIVLKVEATKYSNVTPRRSEFITCDDGSLTFVDPGEPQNIPPGKYTIINDTNLVPAKLVPGLTCKFHFRYGYKVNPVKEIIKEWESEPFLVVEGVNNSAS